MWSFAARAAALVLALSLSGCGAEVETPADEERATLLSGGGTGPLDALTRRFGRLRERMRGRGYDDEVGATRIFLLEDEGVGLPIDLAIARCTTFIGIAGGGVRQLSLAVYDGEGREVAVDATDGEGGLAHVCPQPQAGDTVPHHLVVRSRQGSGAVIVGAFQTVPGAGEGFEDLFDGVLAPQVPFRDVEERLAERRAVLRERGFLPLADPHLERVAEGEDVALRVELAPGRCYVAMARGGEGLTDVDLTLFDPAGAEVARDFDGDAEPDVELCPEIAGRYGVRARAFEGAGALGVLVLGGPEPTDLPESLEPEGVEEGPGTPEPDATPVTDPMAGLTSLTSALETRGYDAPVFVVPDGWVARGEVRSHELALGPGCFVVVGAAGRPETDLDLYLSEGGQTIDRDTGVSPTARVRFCPASNSAARVTVKTYGRGGSYALATVRAPASIQALRALRLEEATAELRDRGWTGGPGADRALAEGEPLRMNVLVRDGRCTALAVAGDEGVIDVDIFLRDPDGRLLASSSGPEAYAAVARCAEDGEENMVAEIVAYRGSGTVLLRRLSGTP